MAIYINIITPILILTALSLAFLLWTWFFCKDPPTGEVHMDGDRIVFDVNNAKIIQVLRYSNRVEIYVNKRLVTP